MRSRHAAAWVMALGAWVGVRPAEAQPTPRPAVPPSRPLLLVHVMPWFEAPPTSPRWGWHWTMGRLDPGTTDAQGRRRLAAHVEPAIGPYDSADPAVLEYQTLLLKIAGADGVIADWYGTDDVNDYASIHRRTVLLADHAERRGLKFALCYEDRVLRTMAEKFRWSAAEATAHAQAHLRAAQEQWFRRPSYVTWEGRPLLLIFGPDVLTAAQLAEALAPLQPAPALFTLHERKPPAVGAYAWPPMFRSQAGRLDPAELDAYFEQFARQPGPHITAAFPGFHDFYAEAGVGPSYGTLDAAAGATFRRTLDHALATGDAIVQLVTWNDFGEGTCIEPTREHGRRELETLQAARRRLPGPPLPYQPADLALPIRLYQLRQSPEARTPARASALDEVATLLTRGDTQGAAAHLDRLHPPIPTAATP